MKAKCPECNHEFEVKSPLTAAEMGKMSRRKDGGGERCPRHGIFLKQGNAHVAKNFGGPEMRDTIEKTLLKRSAFNDTPEVFLDKLEDYILATSDDLVFAYTVAERARIILNKHKLEQTGHHETWVS
jgi:hypothetical protein